MSANVTQKVLMAIHWRKRHVITTIEQLQHELESLLGLSHRIHAMEPEDALQALEIVVGTYPLGGAQGEPPGASEGFVRPVDVDLTTA